jgi:hypothetical protein
MGFAAALAIVVKVGREAATTVQCPHCGKIGTIAKDFGTRVINGRRRCQSWCRDCRNCRNSSRRASLTDFPLLSLATSAH